MTTPSLTACPWCARPLGAGAVVCGGCGAPVNVPIETDAAGWTELPGAKDMAQLQLGASACQIIGKYVPVADFQLAQGDSVFFTHHVLLWNDPSVQIRPRSMQGGWQRLFAGLPLVMTEAEGPGHIAFSRDAPGELIAVPLNPGQSIDVREHVFVAATGNVDYSWFTTDVWYRTRNGDETETHYPLGMFMDRFVARDRPGLLVLHGAGNLFVRTLRDGESLLVKPNALLYKDPTVSAQLLIERAPLSLGVPIPSFGGLLANLVPRALYLWVRVRGPGRVAIQSADKHHHETSGMLAGNSGEIRDW